MSAAISGTFRPLPGCRFAHPGYLLTDGRTLGVPLAWFPRLLRATPAEREKAELSRVGLHWEALDEDVSIGGLLAGHGDVTRSAQQA